MTFSIIVPIYNVEKYLPTCIESILRQTYKEFELILVNDGSNDNSLDVCTEYARIDNRIKIIDKPNGGASSARNAGLSVATGDYILFIDSDDFYLNSYGLESINQIILNNFNSIVFFSFKKDSFTKIKYFDKRIKSFKTIDSNKKIINEIKKGHIIASAWLYCIPKKIFDHTLVFKEGELSEDIEYFFDILKREPKFNFIDNPLYGYRIREGSVSFNVSEKCIIDLEKHLDYMLSYLQSNQFSNKVLNVYFSEQIANYLIALSRGDFDINRGNKYIGYLKYAKRLRSRLIRVSIKLFGAKKTINILRRM